MALLIAVMMCRQLQARQKIARPWQLWQCIACIICMTRVPMCEVPGKSAAHQECQTSQEGSSCYLLSTVAKPQIQFFAMHLESLSHCMDAFAGLLAEARAAGCTAVMRHETL